jgi:putative nucleotidyltransferase with HDIG domain
MQKDKKNSTTLTSTITDSTSNITLNLGKKKVRLPKSFTWMIVILISTILLSIILFPYTTTVQSFNLPKAGNVSKETIISPITFDIIKSSEELDRDRTEAMDQVLEVFYRDIEKKKAVNKKLSDLRTDINTLSDSTITDSLKQGILVFLKKELSDNTISTITEHPYLLDDAIFHANQILDTGILSLLLVPSKQKLSELKEKFNSEFDNHLFYSKDYITIIQDSTEITVKHTDLPVKKMALEIIMNMLRAERMFDQNSLNSLYEILDAYLLPNIMHNGEETTDRRLQASRSVLTTKGKVIKDSEIVRKHQEVTPEIVEKLISLHKAIESKEHGQETQRILQTNLGKIILVITFIMLITYYLIGFHQSIFDNLQHVLALASIIVLQMLIIRISLLIIPKLFEGSTEINVITQEFLIPTATASILVAILFDLRLSVIITLFISLYFSISLSLNHSLFIYSLIGGFIAGFSTQRIRYRWDFFKAIPPIVAVYALFVCVWSLFSFKFTIFAITLNIGLCVINSILTIFLAMMSVAIFETLFDITTDMTLVELSDMNHPLLKRLSIEAAGTYNHSVLVANLAESAAESVNANTLLTRVASYYHDVGKIAKPSYFVENQKMEKNIHDKLAPSMSALIISSHVKEGLELAKKYKLPSVIKSVISQHHGTSTVSFFYEKALEQDQHKQVQEKDFCYPGPKPQTKENAIIMLADSVEAASRSLSTSTTKMVRALVKKIIHDKFASSQLDQCNLTFQDLDKIIDGFMPVLLGIFHTRIEYPNKT